MSTICFFARYEDSSGDGVNGLTVVWDVERIARATGARAALVTGGATTTAVGRRGLYVYTLADADLTLYDYVATAVTASATPTVHEVAALWTLWSLSWGDILSAAWTTANSIGKRIVDYLDTAVSGRSTFDPTSDEVDVGSVKGVAVADVDDFKADVSGLSTFDASSEEVDIGAVKGVAVAGVADFQSDATAANQTTILNRIGSFDGSGYNTILGFLRALMRSDADLPSQVGGDFEVATDSNEAIYDNLAGGEGSATLAQQNEILDRIGAFSGDGNNDILGWLQAIMRSDATLPSQVGGDWDDAGHSLEALRAYVETIAGRVPALVWEEAMSAHETDGTFGNQVRDIESKIWSGSETRSLTYGSVPADDVVAGNLITHYRGTKWSETITGLSLPTTTRTETYLTIKADKNDADSAAIIRISEGSGLLRLNGADGARDYGSITIAEDGTSLTYTVLANATQNISIDTDSDEVTYFYDIKTIASDVGPQVHNPGLWKVKSDIGRAIS